MSIVLGYIKAKIQVYSSYKPPFLIQSSIRDSSLWIPYSIHWIPDFLSMEFLSWVEFWIPWAETRFQDQGIRIPHAIFFLFLEYRIRIPLHGPNIKVKHFPPHLGRCCEMSWSQQVNSLQMNFTSNLITILLQIQ